MTPLDLSPGTPERPWLLNPGPCNTTQTVHDAAHTPDICHREADYLAVQREVRSLLLAGFRLDPARWTSALITGSGTAALEMAVCSAVSATGAMLVIENGVYGERISTICDAHRIPTVRVRAAWTERPALPEVRAALEAHPEVEVVALVHHETTTGLLNPVAEIAAMARAHKKRVLCDTISGLGGDPIDLEALDIAVCTANKLVQGLPGVSFCLVKRDFAADLAGYPPRSLYLNLANYLKQQEVDGTPFTPAVQITYALRQALLELCEETLAARLARVARAAKRLRDGFGRLGLGYYLNPAYLSSTITALRLPEGLTYQALHDHMRAHGYVIYAGQGNLAKEMFRIANMGALTDDALDGVIRALERILK
jgi:2-aminoethylphosphonate-pyruvate transaminase